MQKPQHEGSRVRWVYNLERGSRIFERKKRTTKNVRHYKTREHNWSIPEREGYYAVFYSVTKLEHLLRYVRFVLYTDHENLTYIIYGNLKKVLRWKL